MDTDFSMLTCTSHCWDHSWITKRSLLISFTAEIMLRFLTSRYYPIHPYNRFTPDIPKINKHVCSFRAVCRCWPNIGPSLPMSEDVPGKINVVYRCTLAICGCTYETCRFSHRAPQSGQCKPAFTASPLTTSNL